MTERGIGCICGDEDCELGWGHYLVMEREHKAKLEREEAKRAKLEQHKCAGYDYGCRAMIAPGAVFCPACTREYKEDPDAFK